MLKLENISKTYNSQSVIKNISMELETGEVWGIIGKNGAGKTTLLSIISNLIYPEEGKIYIDSKETSKNFSSDIKRRIGVCFGEDLIEDFSGYEFLKFRSELFGIKSADIIISQLCSFLFDDINELKKPIKSFSFGMKKKVSIIASLIHKPEIVIWDEPFNGLDFIAVQKVIHLTNTYKSSERTFIISSHDLKIVDEVCTHIAVINSGKIIFQNRKELLYISSDRFDSKIIELLGETNITNYNLDSIN